MSKIEMFKNRVELPEIIDNFILTLNNEQARQINLLAVIASETSLQTPYITLSDYQEGYGSGYSICDCDSDIESFSHTSLHLDDKWVTESAGDRYKDSKVYPYACTVDTDYEVSIIAAMPLNTWQVACIKLFDKYTSYAYTAGMEPKDIISILDNIMCDINKILLPEIKYYNICTNGPSAPLDAIDSICNYTEIQDYYLVSVDYIQCRPNNSYYCTTGDSPVIWDQTVQWSMLYESAGGWSRLDPSNEENYNQRNNLDIMDISDINGADAPLDDTLDGIKNNNDRILEKNRGWDFTRRLAREKLEREIRYESYMMCLTNARSLHGLHVHMLAIEVAYKRSLWLCERAGGFTKHGLVSILITRKQLDSLRNVYQSSLVRYKGQQLQRRTAYLGYAVAIHQSDKTFGNVKASQRIMQSFRAINKSTIGPKYYTKLVDIKNRMFKFILRNIKKTEPKQESIPSQSDGYQQYLNSVPIE